MLGGDFDAPQGERYEVFWSDDDDGVQSYTYVTAVRQYDNARLIAAAPGLLAALKRTLSMAIGHAADARGVSPAECRDFPWARDAQAAIDNATEGEEE
jgi:hypothetical protein